MTPDRLAEIHRAAFIVPRPWRAPEFQSFLSDPKTFLTAGPNAFSLGRVIADEAELLTVAVHPDDQGQGWGRACLRGFETHAREREARHAFLEVAADNATALGLYRSFGYEITGRRSAYYVAPDGRKLDALTMAKSINSA